MTTTTTATTPDLTELNAMLAETEAAFTASFNAHLASLEYEEADAPLVNYGLIDSHLEQMIWLAELNGQVAFAAELRDAQLEFFCHQVDELCEAVPTKAARYVDYRIIASESEVAPLLAAFTDAGLSFYVDSNAIAATFNDGPDPKATIDAIARQFNVPVMRYTPSASE